MSYIVPSLVDSCPCTQNRGLEQISLRYLPTYAILWYLEQRSKCNPALRWVPYQALLLLSFKVRHKWESNWTTPNTKAHQLERLCGVMRIHSRQKQKRQEVQSPSALTERFHSRAAEQRAMYAASSFHFCHVLESCTYPQDKCGSWSSRCGGRRLPRAWQAKGTACAFLKDTVPLRLPAAQAHNQNCAAWRALKTEEFAIFWLKQLQSMI